MNVLSSPFRKYKVDYSDRENFSFSFFCDCCGKEWESSPRPFFPGEFAAPEHEGIRRLLLAMERRSAFEQANSEAFLHFNKCSECGRWVCDECFYEEGRENYGLCRECSENL